MYYLADVSLESKVEILWWGFPALGILALLVYGIDAKGARKWIQDHLRQSRLGDAERQIAVYVDSAKTTEAEINALLTKLKAQVHETNALIDAMKKMAPAQLPAFEIQQGQFGFQLGPNAPYGSDMVVFDKPFQKLPAVFISECRGGNWLLVKIDSRDLQKFKWAAHRVFVTMPETLQGQYTTELQWIAIAAKN